MASSSSSYQKNQRLNAFSGIEPDGKRRKVSESSRLFDVFINHRGPDVKHTLATQLYNSLKEVGIRAFLDSEEKELGESFPSTIESAIRSATVHIAIFSKTYAESAWCLAELVLMLQTKAKIIPVFYQVKPTALRFIENGEYAEAFTKYAEKKRYLEKLQEWKEALQSLSFVAGEELNSSSDCKNIVAAVQKEVQNKICLHVATYPVGLNNLVEDFERQCLDELVQDFENQCGFEEGKHKASVVGIFGMGGAGKTTLAKELFNRKRSNYSRASFLFDVREACVRSQLTSLQGKLLKDLFQDHNRSFISTEEGKSYLQDHIRRSPPSSFLIVVDDIDHVEQLNALMIIDILNKFGNTLVIVTTRDIGVLITAGITVGYNLKGMDRNDGRELFCWHAFSQPHPSSGYEELVEAFVNVCGGLPLSLQVLGRHVHGRPHIHWRSALIEASKTLPRDVKQRLKISFDALGDEEKQIFMDVACFFIGKPKSIAERVWEGSRWNAHHALETLKDKCLLEETEILSLNINEGLVLRMHDHLRDLGREMALELSPPHRLWRPKDLEYLESMGFKNILAKTHVRCFHSIFDKSMNSRVTFFLGQPDICVETSASLLWLELDANSTEQPSIPSWICLQNVQCLKIRGGRLKPLWENRIQAPSQLKELQIYDAFLEEIPDFLGISNNLEKVVLDARGWPIQGSPLLESLSMNQIMLPSVSRASCLEKIGIYSCEKLQSIMLPTTLISLCVERCRDLQRIVGTGDLTKLTELDIVMCHELEELSSVSRASCLEKIHISSCEKLQNIMLPTTLINLYIHRCRGLQRIVGTGDLTKLTELDINECPELEDLPSVSRASCLEQIRIYSCERLQNIMLPTTLINLSVHRCRGLQSIVGTGDLTKLTELDIDICPELEELPSVSRASCLEQIRIYSCKRLQNIMLPTTLINLSVDRCRGLQRIVGTGDLTKLTELEIDMCPELEELPSFSRASCLEKIRIYSCEKLQNIMLPTTLINLSVHRCRGLQRIVGTGDLTKLTELEIDMCPELEELPSFSRVSCLKHIVIDSSEKLENIAGIQELHISEFMKLRYCSNAVIRNCIQKLKSVPSYCFVNGRAVDGAESTLNEYLFSDAHIGAEAVTDNTKFGAETGEVLSAVIFCFVVVVHSSTSVEDINRSLPPDSDLDLDLDPDSDGLNTESDLDPDSDGLPPDSVFYINRDPDSDFYFNRDPDSDLDLEFEPLIDLNRELQRDLDLCQGEWIITIVAHPRTYPYIKRIEDVLRRYGIMKKGFRVNVREGEEWKIVQVLGTIVDRLHHYE